MRPTRSIWLLAASAIATFSLFLYVVLDTFTADPVEGQGSPAVWAVLPLLVTTLVAAYALWSALRTGRSAESRARQVAQYWLKRSDLLVELATVVESFAATEWPRSSEEDEEYYNASRTRAIGAARALRVELAKLEADAHALERVGAEDEARTLRELITAFGDDPSSMILAKRPDTR